MKEREFLLLTGKRGWNSHFHGGLGKRRWNSNFSGGKLFYFLLTGTECQQSIYKASARGLGTATFREDSAREPGTTTFQVREIVFYCRKAIQVTDVVDLTEPECDGCDGILIN